MRYSTKQKYGYIINRTLKQLQIAVCLSHRISAKDTVQIVGCSDGYYYDTIAKPWFRKVVLELRAMPPDTDYKFEPNIKSIMLDIARYLYNLNIIENKDE